MLSCLCGGRASLTNIVFLYLQIILVSMRSFDHHVMEGQHASYYHFRSWEHELIRVRGLARELSSRLISVFLVDTCDAVCSGQLDTGPGISPLSLPLIPQHHPLSLGLHPSFSSQCLLYFCSLKGPLYWGSFLLLAALPESHSFKALLIW